MAKKVVEKSTSAKKTSAVKSAVKKQVKTVKSAVEKPIAVKKTAVKDKEKKVATVKKEIIVKEKIAPKKSTEKKAETELDVSKVVTKVTVKTDKKAVVTEIKPIPTIVVADKLKPVKSILISQPKPESGKSPYIDLAVQFKIKLDWRPFTHVEGVKAADFRKDKVYIEQYSCVIFTSRFAVEQYFRICEELRVKIKEDNKYFCINEAIALYLQKYVI